ncbi:MAG: hypothetical protein RL266_39 [Bacteroidota bacterium]|jgi:hypothetical protein
MQNNLLITQAMNQKAFVLIGLTLMVLVCILGCKHDDEPAECAPYDCLPPVASQSLGTVPLDTVCLGKWQWSYTIEQNRFSGSGWLTVDTLYPGDEVEGFESLSEYSMTIDDRSITISRNGEIVSCGCYSEWSSRIIQNLGSGNDSAVQAFYTWDLHSEIIYRGWAVWLSGTDAFNTSLVSAEPYNTTLPEEPTYEEETAIRFRSVFIKVE